MRSEKLNILLVEDNPADADLIQETLKEITQPQPNLSHVSRLIEAKQQLASGHFDVILLDLSLPDSFGLETVKQAHQFADHLPIIILTGNEDSTVALNAVQLGAQDYLVKGWTDSALLMRTITYAIERKRSQEALRRSEKRFRTVIEENGDGIVVIDKQNIIRFVNSKAEALFDRPAEALLNKLFDIPLKPEKITESEIKLTNGKTVPVSIHLVEIDWEGESVYLASLRDITDRRNIEKELQLYREHLEKLIQERTARLEDALVDVIKAHDNIDAIINSIADGLVVIDLNYRILIANPAARDLFDFQPGDKLLTLEPGLKQKYQWLRDLIESAFTHQIRNCEIDIKLEDHRSGELKILHVHASLVDNRNHELLGAVTIIRDVTRLREVDRLKTEFLTLAAHELRTPLTSILGFSELLSHRQFDSQRQQRYLSMIHERAIHLAEIISNLLDIAQLEAGRNMEITLEPVDFRSLIEIVAGSFVEKSAKHSFEFDCAAAIPLIAGDSTRLKQVCHNLLSNAVNFSPLGGVITIRLRVLPQFMQVSIQDEGIGMTPEQLERLFEQFYRANTSNTAIGGTGLGLTISKLIINLHQGEIWVESEPNQGTTVYFTLPLTDSWLET